MIWKNFTSESVMVLATYTINQDFPGGTTCKESACNAGDGGSISGWGRSPEEGEGNPLQCSCLENPMDREAWWATVHGVSKESDTNNQKQQRVVKVDILACFLSFANYVSFFFFLLLSCFSLFSA